MWGWGLLAGERCGWGVLESRGIPALRPGDLLMKQSLLSALVRCPAERLCRRPAGRLHLDDGFVVKHEST